MQFSILIYQLKQKQYIRFVFTVTYGFSMWCMHFLHEVMNSLPWMKIVQTIQQKKAFPRENKSVVSLFTYVKSWSTGLMYGFQKKKKKEIDHLTA